MINIEEMRVNLMLSKAVVAKDKNGNVIFWLTVIEKGGFSSVTGTIKDHNVISNLKRKFIIVNPNVLRGISAQIDFEIKARYKYKVNSGFKSLSHYGLKYVTNSDSYVSNEGITIYKVFHYLNRAIPISRSDNKGNFKPMLCKPFKENMCSYPMYAQPKLNGIRGCVRWLEYEEGEGMFKKNVEGAVFTSREGKVYVLPHLSKHFTKDMFYARNEDLVYDGELYIHGATLNTIRSSCPMLLDNGTLSKPSGDPEKVKFWCFDLAILLQQRDRFDILNIKFKRFAITFDDLDSEINANIVLLPTKTINNDLDFIMFSRWCIDKGFEGAIGRNPEALYRHGYRGNDMVKLKQAKHTECIVVDVVPKSKEPETGLFILRNDINDETFECNPMGTFAERKEYLDNAESYIGKKATVRFYERSGVKKCPFHANVETIRDYE